MSSYDAWKTRAPEDEPGYWDNHPPECHEFYHDHQCLGCGQYKSVCASCQLCEGCQLDAEGEERV